MLRVESLLRIAQDEGEAERHDERNFEVGKVRVSKGVIEPELFELA